MRNQVQHFRILLSRHPRLPPGPGSGVLLAGYTQDLSGGGSGVLLQLVKFINGDEFSWLAQFLKLFGFLFGQRACFLFLQKPSGSNPVIFGRHDVKNNSPGAQ